MPGIIVIGGAPGTGKSTLALALRDALGSPWIDFGRLREFHLKRDWSNQSPAEEQMTFENLISISRNYLRHGYANVIIDDLQDARVQQMPTVLHDLPLHILTLFVTDPSVLRRRLASRSDGWTNADAAIEWNQRVIQRPCVRCEWKIDVTTKSPAEVLDEAFAVLESGTARRGDRRSNQDSTRETVGTKDDEFAW
jgi:predicted kinase